jgi:uncharacterized membrane protein
MINFNKTDSKHLGLVHVDGMGADQTNSGRSDHPNGMGADQVNSGRSDQPNGVGPDQANSARPDQPNGEGPDQANSVGSEQANSRPPNSEPDFGNLDYGALTFEKLEFEKIDFGNLNIEPLEIGELTPMSFPSTTITFEDQSFEDAGARVELLKVHSILSHMSARLDKVEQYCQPTARTSVTLVDSSSNIHSSPYSRSRQRQVLRAVELHSNEEVSTDSQKSNPPADSAEPQTSGSVEMRIGKYWLNRIGIGSLVLGVVFLLLYSYQFFGVIGKLLIGFLASTILVVGGDRIARHKGEEWYGNALIGGGWALMYFSAYAMHFVPQLKIIDSFALELVPLFGVAAGAMWHGVKSKSEVIGLIATLFGILAISFGPASILSDVGYFGIAAIASLVAINMRWTKQMYVAIVSCYGAFTCTTGRLLIPGFEWSVADSWWSVAALASYWSVFNAAMVTFAEGDSNSRNSMIGFTWINVLLFTMGTFIVASTHLHDWLYWIFGGAATLYIMTEHTLEQRKLPFLSTLHILFGLALLNIAFCLKFHGVDLQNIVFIEVPILSAIYLQTNKWVYANFASTLAIMCMLDWTCANLWIDASYPILGIKSLPHFLSGIVAATAFAATHMLFQHATDATAQSDLSSASELDFLPKRNLAQLYYVLTQVAVAALPLSFVQHDGCTLYWSIQACIATVFSIWKRSAIYSSCTNALIVLATAALAFSSVNEIKPLVCLSVGLFYFVDWFLSHRGYAERAALILGKRMYAHLANLVVCLLMFQLHQEYITLALGIAGMAMLIVGFAARLQVYRGWGLVMLGFLTGKLLLVDLAKADTMERIVAFIAAGGICLGCSYAYSKFAEKPEPQPRTDEQLA